MPYYTEIITISIFAYVCVAVARPTVAHRTATFSLQHGAVATYSYSYTCICSYIAVAVAVQYWSTALHLQLHSVLELHAVS